jgi:hypothetical protein
MVKPCFEPPVLTDGNALASKNGSKSMTKTNTSDSAEAPKRVRCGLLTFLFQEGKDETALLAAEAIYVMLRANHLRREAAKEKLETASVTLLAAWTWAHTALHLIHQNIRRFDFIDIEQSALGVEVAGSMGAEKLDEATARSHAQFCLTHALEAISHYQHLDPKAPDFNELRQRREFEPLWDRVAVLNEHTCFNHRTDGRFFLIVADHPDEQSMIMKTLAGAQVFHYWEISRPNK